MKKLLFFLALMPLYAMGQGVHFENGLSWQQIKQKAKAENKYIFVDCYASWCGPCKLMDRNIYPNDSVGKALNPEFISVKVQMDTSKNDDENVKAWYTDAHVLRTAYGISEFPSFLFFSPEGRIVHRGRGYQKPKEFIELIADALRPDKQYYTRLERYRSGIVDYSKLPYLVYDVKTYNGEDSAMPIASDYLHNYLDKLNDREICTKENLAFIVDFAKILTSRDRVFECLYRHGKLADSAMHYVEYGRKIVSYVIANEEFTPKAEKARSAGKEPNWKEISNNIKHDFGGDYAKEIVVQCQMWWYSSKKEWKNYIKYLIIWMDTGGSENIPNGIAGVYQLNGYAWDVFQRSDDREELEKALVWSDRAIGMQNKPSGFALDTKANILYKLGEKGTAMDLETKALELDPKNKGINENLEKMQKGEPTWVVTK